MLSNGSPVAIGQPLVGIMSWPAEISINVGVVPALLETNVLPPQPPLIINARFVGSVFEMDIANSNSGQTYALEASTNLIDWVFLRAQTGNGLQITLWDTADATNMPIRFYRVSF